MLVVQQAEVRQSESFFNRGTKKVQEFIFFAKSKHVLKKYFVQKMFEGKKCIECERNKYFVVFLKTCEFSSGLFENGGKAFLAGKWIRHDDKERRWIRGTENSGVY